MLIAILWVAGCIVVTVVVVVFWSALVLGARCDRQMEALQALLQLGDKGNGQEGEEETIER